MVVPAAGSCLHEIRPGTTVCLHCRKEERLARIARRRRSIARVFGVVAGVAVCGVIANAPAGAFDLRLPKLDSLPSLPSLPSLASLGEAVTARPTHAPARSKPP